MKNKVLAVVSAYNEEKTIGDVLEVLKKVKPVDDILVIDDGSKDMTKKIAKDKGIEVVSFKDNLGKSLAIKKALKNLSYEVVFFCDADLIGLKAEYCNKIIRSVIEGRSAMCVGISDRGVLINYPSSRLPITGQRAIKSNVLKTCMNSKYFRGYGMETVMNMYCRINKLKVKCYIFDYKQVFSIEKRGLIKGMKLALPQVWLIPRIYLSLKLFGWR